MRRVLLMIGLMAQLAAGEYLPDKYLVTYGNEDAEIRVTEYYSFQCPHCIALFRRDFMEIKDRFIDQGEICFTFHPVPLDLVTVQAMDCLEKLSNNEKRIFLEALFEKVELDADIAVSMMERAMEILGHPVPKLSEQAYLENTSAFAEAFEYLKIDEKPEAIPSVAVNGVYLPGEVPDGSLIERCLGGRRG